MLGGGSCVKLSFVMSLPCAMSGSVFAEVAPSGSPYTPFAVDLCKLCLP